MALVDRRGLTRNALPEVAASRAAAKKQHRHRVVIESVAQEQKQLKTTVGRVLVTHARWLIPHRYPSEQLLRLDILSSRPATLTSRLL
jgi:hypothetical protein